jgi:hypothetical protein
MSAQRRYHRYHHLHRLTLFLPSSIRASSPRARYPLHGITLFLTPLTYQCSLREKFRPSKYHPDIFPHTTHVSRGSVLSTFCTHRHMGHHLSLESSRMDDR